MKNLEYQTKKFDEGQNIALTKKLKAINDKYEKLHSYHHKKDSDGVFTYPNHNYMVRTRDKFVDVCMAAWLNVHTRKSESALKTQSHTQR